LCLQRRVQPAQPPGPEVALPFDPAGGFVQRARGKGKQVLAARHAPADQPGLLQNAHVLGDGVERHGEGRRDVGHPRPAVGQAIQDRPPRRVGQGLQGGVEEHHSTNRLNV
jgi:hypothetical protein